GRKAGRQEGRNSGQQGRWVGIKAGRVVAFSAFTFLPSPFCPPALQPSVPAFPPFCLPALQGIILVSTDTQGARCEGSHPPEVLRRRGALRVRGDVEDAVDQAGAAPRNLLELPPVLHGQAEAARYRRPRRA